MRHFQSRALRALRSRFSGVLIAIVTVLQSDLGEMAQVGAGAMTG